MTVIASDQASPAPTGEPAGPWQLYSGTQRWAFLAILFFVCTSNYIDRQILSILVEPIKREFHASDLQMGLLGGLSFALFYAILGIPVARLADRGDRRLVIAVSLAVWSVMTALCGVAQNFWQLALARVGVGMGEAGAIPPGQSLIADYFPPEKRTRALAVFMSAATVGYLVAFIGGAQIAAAHGWRAAFLVMGLPGLVLALIAWFGLQEPRRSSRRPEVGEHVIVPLGATLKALAAKRTYVLLTTAFVVYFLMAYGALIFAPAYLIRVLGQDLAKVGAVYGLLGALATVAGTLGGGFLTDRLVRRDLRWTIRVPAIGLIVACPLYELAFLSQSLTTFYFASFAAGLILAAAVPPMFTALHLVCGSSRRAMAVAIALFFANLIGIGGGPAITGFLSDVFTARYGAEGLRYAIAIALLLLVPAGLVLLTAQSSLARDRED